MYDYLQDSYFVLHLPDLIIISYLYITNDYMVWKFPEIQVGQECCKERCNVTCSSTAFSVHVYASAKWLNVTRHILIE